MLSVRGVNDFYYVGDFRDMGCKERGVLCVIGEGVEGEGNDGEVFIVMCGNGRIVGMF